MLWKVVFLSAVGGFLFGYDLGLIAGALPHLSREFELVGSMSESVVSIAKYAGVLGTVVGGVIMLKYGRKKAITYHCLVFVAGFATCAFANSYEVLLLGRFMVGLGYGISAVVIPQYLGEMSPPKVRGQIVVTYEIVICVGTVSGAIMDHMLVDNWRAMMMLPILPALLCFVMMQQLPECPSWLIMAGEYQQASQVLKSLPSNPLNFEVDLDNLENNETLNLQKSEGIEHHKLRRGSGISRSGSGTRLSSRYDLGSTGFWEVLYDMLYDMTVILFGNEGRAVCIAVVLAFFNQACASTAIINYAPTLLGKMGAEQATLQSVLIGVAKGCGVCGAVLLVDKWGRKPLLICGGVGCGISMCVMTFSCYMDDSRMCLLVLCVFIFCFSISQAGVFWVVVSELFSMKVKSPAASLTMAVLFLSAGLTNQTYLSMYMLLGCQAFLFYAMISFLFALYVTVWLPETKGRALKEIQELINVRQVNRDGERDS
eukprot:TRINITY_DN1289_c2_g2_i1.p1 TRINITY_DN1289_c2_g2~~TRINITY_DN1289_c2_g2_i1.p1  ORF type:complete len:485 (-),score=61.54 TRINITY_DN1289_c2_g2_i1:318-1772(-)